MNPSTPLRRSDRLRHPTAKAIGSSPSSSPGTAAHVGRSIGSRSRVFSVPDGQTDSDSTLRNTTSSKSSGSSTEDTVRDATDSMAVVASFPPKLYEAYKGLAPIFGYSDAELRRLDIPSLGTYLTELNKFLRNVVLAGFSLQWPEFNSAMELCKRIANVIDAKKGTRSRKAPKREENGFLRMEKGLEFAVGPTWVAMKGEHWQEAWRDTADTGYIQSMYKNAAPPSNFSWDDVGAGGSGEVQVAETDVLDYSLSYPPARTLDYCTIPDTY